MNKLNFFFAMLLCIFSLSFLASNMASAEVFLSEDFESVTPGGLPSNWWSYVWVSECFHRAWVEEIDSNNVLSMSCDWASVAGPSSLVLLDYAVEADAYMMLRDDPVPGECYTGLTKGAIFYLRSYTKGTPHQRGGYIIQFDPYYNRVYVMISNYGYTGNVIIGEKHLEDISINLEVDEWYKLKASVTGDTYGDIIIKAYIDDMTTPVLEVIDDGSAWGTDPNCYKGFSPGYTAFSGYYAKNYYDNIKIFEISANQAPFADPNGPYSGDEGSDIYFDGTSSWDPDGDLLTTYFWDFGDQKSGTGVTTTHIYDDDGTYNVCLTVTDSNGASSTQCTTATIANVAPAVEPISAPLNPVQLGVSIDAQASFADAGTADTHTAVWDWGDGNSDTIDPETSPSLTSHTYDTPGVYTIDLTVTDDDGGVGTSMFQYVVVYDPTGGFVTGGGWINSPEGAYPAEPTLTGKANFGFVSKYKKGATTPTGETEFQFKLADLNFHSDSYDWLVIAGAKAMYKGSGTINGMGNYGFMLSAIDAKLTPSTDADLFRIKIWDKDSGDVVIYDNQVGEADDADPTTSIGGGSIVIHNPK